MLKRRDRFYEEEGVPRTGDASVDRALQVLADRIDQTRDRVGSRAREVEAQTQKPTGSVEVFQDERLDEYRLRISTDDGYAVSDPEAPGAFKLQSRLPTLNHRLPLYEGVRMDVRPLPSSRHDPTIRYQVDIVSVQRGWSLFWEVLVDGRDVTSGEGDTFTQVGSFTDATSFQGTKIIKVDKRDIDLPGDDKIIRFWATNFTRRQTQPIVFTIPTGDWATILAATLRYDKLNVQVVIENLVVDNDTDTVDAELYADDDLTTVLASATDIATGQAFSVAGYAAQTIHAKLTPRAVSGTAGQVRWFSVDLPHDVGTPPSTGNVDQIAHWILSKNHLQGYLGAYRQPSIQWKDDWLYLPQASNTYTFEIEGTKMDTRGGSYPVIPTTLRRQGATGYAWTESDFSLAVVFKNDPGGTDEILRINYANGKYIAVEAQAGGIIQANYNDGSNRTTSIDAGSDGSYHVFIITFDVSTGDLELYSVNQNDRGALLKNTNTAGAALGATSATSVNLFRAQGSLTINQVAVYDRILTPGQAVGEMAELAKIGSFYGAHVEVNFDDRFGNLQTILTPWVKIGDLDLAVSGSSSSIRVGTLLIGVAKDQRLVLHHPTTYESIEVVTGNYYLKGGQTTISLDQSYSFPSLPTGTPVYVFTDVVSNWVQEARRAYVAEALNATNISTNSGDITGLDSRLTAAEDEVGEWGSSDPNWVRTSATAISWGSFTIYYKDGNNYVVNAGSITGLTSTIRHIYWDVNSPTVLQNSTNASNTQGEGKILIATAQSGTIRAKLIPRVGTLLMDRDNIGADTITANEILANTITASEIVGATLSAIYADLGTITAGTITGVTAKFGTFGSEEVILDGSGINILASASYDATRAYTLSEGATVRVSLYYNTTTNTGYLTTGNTGDDFNIEAAGDIDLITTAGYVQLAPTGDVWLSPSGVVYIDGTQWPSTSPVTGNVLRASAADTLAWVAETTLDVDKVDGLHAASFLRSDASDTAANLITFADGRIAIDTYASGNPPTHPSNPSAGHVYIYVVEDTGVGAPGHYLYAKFDDGSQVQLATNA